MASLNSNEKRHFDDAGDMRRHYDNVRNRLKNTRGAEAQHRGGVGEPPEPPVIGASPEALGAPPGDSPNAIAAIPIDIRDVVVSVAAALAVSPSALLCDLGRTASLGRRIAAALVVRRSEMRPSDVAQRFGIAEAMIHNALVTLDATLTATHASVTHAPLVPLVELLVAEWRRFEEPARARMPIAEIQETVARVYRVSVDDMKSSRRSDGIVTPRHVAIYLAKRFTLRSFPEIGRAFARDHSTVVYALAKIKPHADAIAGQMPPNASIADWARALRKQMT